MGGHFEELAAKETAEKEKAATKQAASEPLMTQVQTRRNTTPSTTAAAAPAPERQVDPLTMQRWMADPTIRV